MLAKIKVPIRQLLILVAAATIITAAGCGTDETASDADSGPETVEEMEYYGAKYSGEVSDDIPNGQGTIIWPDGDQYVGGFVDGMFDGQGTYTHGEGDSYGNIYVGEFKEDMMHGQGVFTFNDGDEYAGEFADDKFNGHGTYTKADGSTYTGTWANNELVDLD